MSKRPVFEVHDISAVLNVLIELDEKAIDESMYLIEEEIDMLKRSKGFAVVCYADNAVIGAGYAVSSREAAEILCEFDKEFEPDDLQMYIYSVIVAPEHRNNGLGSALVKTIERIGKENGFNTCSSHVHVVGNLADVCESRCKPFEIRLIEDFWPDLEDKDVKFMHYNL